GLVCPPKAALGSARRSEGRRSNSQICAKMEAPGRTPPRAEAVFSGGIADRRRAQPVLEAPRRGAFSRESTTLSRPSNEAMRDLELSIASRRASQSRTDKGIRLALAARAARSVSFARSGGHECPPDLRFAAATVLSHP